jgi:4-hydroxy-4-methyl-2-oxoglutarate aldolase
MPPGKTDIEILKQFNTPTVSNAIELFNLRPFNTGFMSPEIRCLFPDLGVMVGYAITARFAADQTPQNAASRYELWKFIMETPAPRIMVMQDLDTPPGMGAYFGEVQSTIHTRLGCVGVVTNGHVRDLDEVHPMGFHYFAGGVCVSHAYVHLVEFGSPVEVGGVTVKSGDLIHADKHGVLIVPEQIVAQIPAAVAQVSEREQRIMGVCKSPDFSLDKLKQVYESR